MSEVILGKDIGLGGVGVHLGVTFNFGSAKLRSPAIYETCFTYDKDFWIAANDYNTTLQCTL